MDSPSTTTYDTQAALMVNQVGTLSGLAQVDPSGPPPEDPDNPTKTCKYCDLQFDSLCLKILHYKYGKCLLLLKKDYMDSCGIVADSDLVDIKSVLLEKVMTNQPGSIYNITLKGTSFCFISQ